MRYVFLMLTSLLVWSAFNPVHADAGVPAPRDPLGMILTWQQAPTTTMTIDWHEREMVPAKVHFREKGLEEWRQQDGHSLAFPYSDLIIKRVELTGLKPDTLYEFRVGEYTRTRKFRTMPDNVVERPVRFAIGGDVRHRIEWTEQTNRQAMKYDPDFVVWGGDLAYADGRPDRAYRWYEMINSMMHTLVTPDGRNVPVVVGIGNHEVKGGYYFRDEHERRQGVPAYSQTDESRAAIAPYFFSLFAFPGQPGYGVLDFGDYMSLVALDTDHSNPVEGAQTDWLERVLEERAGVQHVFPFYHVGGFPSVRDPGGDTHVRVREGWVPLFEQYGVRVAFEHHDHSYKRTYPIRNGKVSADGIVYIGDGSWGTRTREIGARHEEHAWYLKRAAAERHAVIATIHGTHQHFMAVSEDGHIIDEYPRTTHVDLGIRRFAEVWRSSAEAGAGAE